GSAALDILKDVGINIGVKLTRQMLLRIPREVLKKVNQAVGFRLVTKAGSKGAVNLIKGVPLVGGVVGGTFDAAATKAHRRDVELARSHRLPKRLVEQLHRALDRRRGVIDAQRHRPNPRS